MQKTICTAGISRFRVSPKGNISPCEMLRHIHFGNIYNSSFKEIIESNERQEWITSFFKKIQNNNCNSCDAKQYCLSCIGINYLENNQYNNISKYMCDMAQYQKELSKYNAIK